MTDQLSLTLSNMSVHPILIGAESPRWINMFTRTVGKYTDKILDDTKEDGDVPALQVRKAAIEKSIASFMETQSSLGQTILYALWTMNNESLFSLSSEDASGNNHRHETMVGWASDFFGTAPDADGEHGPGNAKYVMSLVKIVVHLFEKIKYQSSMKSPFMDSEGSEITVESLINTRGMIAKLIIISEIFNPLSEGDIGNSEQDIADKQQLLLTAALTTSRLGVQKAKKALTAGVDDDIDLPYRVVQNQDRYLIEIDAPNVKSLAAFRVMIGKYGKESM